MRRFRVTEADSRGFYLGGGWDEGMKKVFSFSFYRTQYVWEFGAGDGYDWDGYDQMVGGKWLTPEEAEC